eukprot:3495138-Rhodomonas_salina.1
MDTLGSCDPYCTLTFQNQTKTTSTKMRNYNPHWEETFLFRIPDVRAAVGELHIHVLDWDMVGAHDRVGSAIISEDVMAQIARGTLGWRGEGWFDVFDDKDQGVVGHDKQSCYLILRIHVTSAAAPLAPPPAAPEAAGARRVALTVLRVSHLPKVRGARGRGGAADGGGGATSTRGGEKGEEEEEEEEGEEERDEAADD